MKTVVRASRGWSGRGYVPAVSEVYFYYLRAKLPYGVWTCAGGREVLFNRGYKPMWERVGGVVKRADPKEWVNGIVRQEYFFYDGNPPWRDRETRARCREVLRAWGVLEEMPNLDCLAIDGQLRARVERAVAKYAERGEPNYGA